MFYLFRYISPNILLPQSISFKPLVFSLKLLIIKPNSLDAYIQFGQNLIDPHYNSIKFQIFRLI